MELKRPVRLEIMLVRGTGKSISLITPPRTGLTLTTPQPKVLELKLVKTSTNTTISADWSRRDW